MTEKDCAHVSNLSTEKLACFYDYINQIEDYDKKINEKKEKIITQI